MPSSQQSNRNQARLDALLRKRGVSKTEEASDSRIVAEFSAQALQSNYLAIQKQVPSLSMLPMVKANAYGHGAVWAAKILYKMPNLYALGVATLREGREIREALGASGRKVPIHVFSGCAPWSDERGRYCEKFNLTPVICTDEDWQKFFKGKWPAKIPFELKFNTGMNRLGISLSKAEEVRRQIETKGVEWHPEGILSHLAIAESPDSKLSQKQLSGFQSLRSVFSTAFSKTHFHLANSSGIWNQKYFQLSDLSDVVRPGISLYGVPPWPEAPPREITAVATLNACVIQIRELKEGESVGYGAKYKVQSGEKARVAILSAGYADGIHRMLSGGGEVWVSGHKGNFLGTVSMDLSAVSCAATTKVGEFVEILGPHIDIWKQAQKAGTIPYELLTSLSGRVERRYV